MHLWRIPLLGLSLRLLYGSRLACKLPSLLLRIIGSCLLGATGFFLLSYFFSFQLSAVSSAICFHILTFFHLGHALVIKAWFDSILHFQNRGILCCRMNFVAKVKLRALVAILEHEGRIRTKEVLCHTPPLYGKYEIL